MIFLQQLLGVVLIGMGCLLVAGIALALIAAFTDYFE